MDDANSLILTTSKVDSVLAGFFCQRSQKELWNCTEMIMHVAHNIDKFSNILNSMYLPRMFQFIRLQH